MATIILPNADGSSSEFPVDNFKFRTQDGVELEVHCPSDGNTRRGDLVLCVFTEEHSLVVRPCCSNVIAVGLEVRKLKSADVSEADSPT
ncbi:MAG: hypothetical protein KF735_09405 [Chelatococcus sp.]|uniref:hypothetical protein n=1 Tax=unclassified Chelatococcus TaxID=2638111 RepID=UPI001BCF8794|nr:MULTISPECIES: hypothetical protein [unclassified Chelatococcus]CAH1670091.1 conserved hypothetical protein [Hyphomicrobiales bacterium]MBS7738293.1 hypothetical protein [Chelatococcus sp. HY11]MBX3537843.1 hypothetical protein [Chelatococcus sp.]MBX3545821.1 hypothetical protein [Chelatococcus sp.]MCO5077361.1 hypothetical protein [Chelatococcus sp.]